MDFIHPGFCYSQQSQTEGQPTTDPQATPAVKCIPGSLQQKGQTNNQRPVPGVMKTHWKNMEALRKRKTVHLSRSLDHYCHKRVSSEELQERDKDQVLTRFMKRQLSTSRDPSPDRGKAEDLTHSWSLLSNMVNALRLFIPKYRNSRQSAFSVERGLQGGKHTEEAVENTTKDESTATSTGDILPPLQILVAPQMWLWKFDSEFGYFKRI